VSGERVARVWARIAAAHEGSVPVSVAALCRAAVHWLGVDGASVTAVSALGAREPLFASDELSARLEELLLATGEGPGEEDFRFGSPMLIPDLEAVAARWPGFVSAAVAGGARAVFALPLQAGAIRVGVLSLYRALPGPLGPQELADVLVFADIALRMVLDSAAGISGSPGYRPLDGLPDSRAEVYQAAGMISVQLGVSLEEAFVRLRAHAFATGMALSDAAGEVISRVLRFDPDPDPDPDPGL
jgi:ANTAR domain